MAEPPPSLAVLLSRLTDQDLETVVERRPEVAELADGRPIEWVHLAGILSRPTPLGVAIGGLNRFLLQALHLGCLTGGQLTVAAAGAQGMSQDNLRRAGTELARWGLAFPDAEGGLVVPIEVREQVRDPGGLGRSVVDLGQNLRLEELRRIAITFGLRNSDQPPRKADLLETLSRLMANPAAVTGVLADAPPGALSAFQQLRQERATNWGRPGWHGSWYHQRASDGPPWLIEHGLAMPAEGRYDLFEIPAEVELALRGTVFPSWPSDPPDLDPAPLRGERHPVEAVNELGIILAA